MKRALAVALLAASAAQASDLADASNRARAEGRRGTFSAVESTIQADRPPVSYDWPVEPEPAAAPPAEPESPQDVPVYEYWVGGGSWGWGGPRNPGRDRVSHHRAPSARPVGLARPTHPIAAAPAGPSRAFFLTVPGGSSHAAPGPTTFAGRS